MPKADQREAAKKFLYGLSIQMGNNWSWGYNYLAKRLIKKNINQKQSVTKTENKLLRYYNPDGSFEFTKCAKWILRCLKKQVK